MKPTEQIKQFADKHGLIMLKYKVEGISPMEGYDLCFSENVQGGVYKAMTKKVGGESVVVFLPIFASVELTPSILETWQITFHKLPVGRGRYIATRHDSVRPDWLGRSLRTAWAAYISHVRPLTVR